MPEREREPDRKGMGTLPLICSLPSNDSGGDLLEFLGQRECGGAAGGGE